MTLKRSVLAWTVQAVLCRSTITIKSTKKRIARTPLPLNLTQKPNQSEQKIIVYREYFLKLLKTPKCLRDQIVIELPTLEGFRSGEVSSLRKEYIHFDSGDIEVLDSKKGKLFTLPLDETLAKHLDEYIQKQGIKEGIVIQPLPNAPHTGRKEGSKTLGVGLSDNAIEYIWKKCCIMANVPVMSPRMGRAFLAVMEHFVHGKPIGYIKFVLRHDTLQATEHYVYSRIVDYGDMKALFYRGKSEAFSLLSPCQLKDTCHGYEPGCRCRMFQKVEVKAEA